MAEIQKTRWKLTDEQINKLIFLYSKEGWRVRHLSFYFGLDKKSVEYHVKNVRREVEIFKGIPNGVIRFYPQQWAKQQKPRHIKKEVCQCKFWTRRCSGCNKLLGSEKTWDDSLRSIVFDLEKLGNSKEIKSIISKVESLA